MPRRRRKLYVRKRRNAMSRALRGTIRQWAEMPTWLKYVCAGVCQCFILLATASILWGVLEWIQLVGTLLCASAALVVVLQLLRSREG
jgi:hypothetical protein